jgi:hypothetical protein
MKPLLIVGVLVGMATGVVATASQVSQGAKAVEHIALVALVPTVTGWTRGEVSGSRDELMGMSFSRAETEYTKGNVTVRLEIVDTALIPMMVMPFSMAASGSLNEKSAEGYKRGTTVNGSPGWEEWTNDGKNGDVNVLVAGRFLVHGSGGDLPGFEPIREIMAAIPMARLAALK